MLLCLCALSLCSGSIPEVTYASLLKKCWITGKDGVLTDYHAINERFVPTSGVTCAHFAFDHPDENESTVVATRLSLSGL